MRRLSDESDRATARASTSSPSKYSCGGSSSSGGGATRTNDVAPPAARGALHHSLAAHAQASPPAPSPGELGGHVLGLVETPSKKAAGNGMPCDKHPRHRDHDDHAEEEEEDGDDDEEESEGDEEGAELEALEESSEEEEESDEDDMVELEALDNPDISPETLRTAIRSPTNHASIPPPPAASSPAATAATGGRAGGYGSKGAKGGYGSKASSGAGSEASKELAMAGIGVLVQRLGGLITVVDLVEGGPAHLSGQLRIGQTVLEVDGQAVDQLSFKSVLQVLLPPLPSPFTPTLLLALWAHGPEQEAAAGVPSLQQRLPAATPWPFLFS